MSEVLALGVSHKTAPLAVRERLALTPGKVAAYLHEVQGVAGVQEAVAISTCNRTETYLVASDPVEAETAVLGMLARKAGIRPTELAGSIYALRNCDAARHLYRVTAGLESMIVGEAEVQGQVKRAYEARAGRADDRPAHEPPLPRRARDRQARAHRDRDRRAARSSVSSVAVDARAEQLSASSSGARSLILGAGETSELTAQALARPWRRRRSSSPTAATTARRRWPQRFGGRSCRSTSCRRSSSAPTASSSRPPRRTRCSAPRSSRRDGRARRPAAAADRPRRAARRRSRVRDVAGVDALRHGRPAGGRAAQQSVRAGRGRACRGDRRGGDPALRRVARLAGGAADAERAARARRRRSRAGGAPRTPAAGSRPPSATESASRRSRGRSSTACCTSRRCA